MLISFQMNQFEMIARFIAGRFLPVLASVVVGGLLVLALCLPNPQGPADNGDFARIFTLFCSTPRDLPYFASPEEPNYSKRFFNFYLRYWGIGSEHRAAVQPSSSLALFLPGLLGAFVFRARYYDLTLNAFLLILVLSLVTYLVMYRLSGRLTRLSGFAILLMATDAGCSGYVNSFYQESGVFLYFLLCILSVCLWLEHRTVARVGAVGLFALLLMLSKKGIAPSVAILLLPVLGLSALGWWESRRARYASAVTVILLLIGGLAASFILRNRAYDKIYCHSFIFGAVLPDLEPAERAAFLGGLGIDQTNVAYSGITVWEKGNNFRDPALNVSLGGKLHLRAAWALIVRYPATALRLAMQAARLAGRYDSGEFGYRSVEFSPKRKPLGSIRIWSTFRSRVLTGLPAYVVVGLVVILVFAVAKGSKPGPCRFLPGLAIGSFFASVLQVMISVFGSGPAGLPKHLYFANLTLDTSLVLGAVVLSAHFLRRQEDCVHSKLPGKQ
jgi:hypothetical protein